MSETTPQADAKPETQGVSKELLETLERIGAERGEALARVEALESQIQSLRTRPPEKTPRQSETDLQKLVDDGLITEAQKNERLRAYDREDLRDEADRVATERVRAETHRQMLDAQLAEYRAAYPSAFDGSKSSDERVRVTEAFNHLVELSGRPVPAKGSTELAVLELSALRAALGPPRRPRETTTSTREHDPAVGGGGTAKGGSEPGGEGPPAFLDQRQIDFYQRQIDNGHWQGWNDPAMKRILGQIQKRSEARA